MAITVGQLLVRLGMDLSDFSKGLQDAQKELKRQGDMFADAGAAMSKAVTAPLAAIAGLSVNAFAGFEQSMNKVLALGGKDVAGMFADLEKQAIDLGAATKYSAKEAADAMGELAAAGFKGNEIMSAMPGLLSLAATENMKLADAARIASAVLKGFGLSAKDLQSVADILAQTAAASATSVTELGHAFQYIGPIAKAAGISLIDVSTALGVLGNSGVRGESAGTALRNMLNDLMTPMPKVEAAMKSLGIQTKDAFGKMLPMEELIRNLKPLTENMALGFKLFGQRFSDVLPLISDGGLAFKNLKAEVEKFQGAADAMAKTMMKGIAGNLEQFKGSLETLGISIGKILAPAVNALISFGGKVVDWVQGMVNVFATLPQGVQTAAIAFGALAASLGPVLYIMGTMARGIGDLKLLAPALTGLSGVLKGFGVDLTDLTGRLGEFFRMLSSMTIGSATSGMANVLTTFGKTIKDTFAAIPGQLNNAKTALVQFAATMASAVATNSKAAVASLVGFVDQLKRMGTALKEVNMAQTLGNISTAITSFASSVKAKGMTGLLDDFWIGASKLKDVLGGGFSTALGSASKGILALGSDLAIGGAAFAAVAAAATAAAVVIVRDWEDITRTFNAFTKDIADDTSGLKQKFVDMWVSMAGGPFIAAVITAFQAVGKSAKDLWDGIVLIFNTGIQTLANASAGLVERLGFANTAKSLREWGTSIEVVSGKLNEMSRIKPPISNDAVNSAKALADMVAQYTGEIRLGNKTWQQTVPILNQVGGGIKDAQAQYAKLQNDFKMGLITKAQFQEQSAALDAAVANASAFAGQMSSKFGSAGIDVEKFGKKSKDAMDEFKKAMKMVEGSADKVIDVLEDLPKSMDEFTQKSLKGWKADTTLEKMAEMMRDIGRVMEKETNPIIRKSLAQQVTALDAARKGLQEYQKQWQENVMIEGAQKIVDKLREVQAETAKVDLEHSFNNASIQASTDMFYRMEIAVDKVAKAAGILGVELDEVGIKSGGQFVGIVEHAVKAQAAYELLAKTAGVSAETMRQAWINMTKAVIAASQEAFNTMSIQADGFGKVVSAAWKIGVQEMQVALVEGVRKAQDIMKQAGADLAGALFTFDLSKIGAAVKSFGQSALSALKAAFIEPFQKLFESVLGNLSMQVTKFVTDKIVNWLGKAFEGIFGKLGTTLASTAPLQAAAAQLQVAATQLQAAAASMSVAMGGAKVAGEAASAAAGTAGKAASGAAEAAQGASSAASTASGMLGKVSAISGIVTGAISAVTGVLSYLQGRRMEQDIGRIEVTSREIKAELMNFRADAHVRQEQFFAMKDQIVGEMQRYGDSHGAFLSEILGTLQQANEWLSQINARLGSGVPIMEGSGTGAPPTTPATPQGSGATEANTGAVDANTTATNTNTGATENATTATEVATTTTTTNTGSVGENTSVVTTNTAVTATATTATESLGLAARAAAGELPQYAAQLESFVGRTGKELAMYVKDAGSSLEWSINLFNNGTQRLVRDMKTGIQYVLEVGTDKVLKIYDKQAQVIDEATGKVVRFSSAADKTIGYLGDMANTVNETTNSLDYMASATDAASQRLPAAMAAFTDTVTDTAVALKEQVQKTLPDYQATPNTSVLGSMNPLPPVAPATATNTGTVNWTPSNTVMVGGRPLPSQFASGSSLALEVNVNNADAQQVANTMVQTWRGAGVDI